MEDNIQTIIAVIISAFLLFIFPVYMAYEKKDDISYALAMRYTQDLVDEVRNKGYITRDMYEDYRVKLGVTGNTYDIQMTHEYNRYDPITNYYTVDEDNKYSLVKTTTQEEKEKLIEDAIDIGELEKNATKKAQDKYLASVYEYENKNMRSEDTYRISKQVYTTEHILNILESEKKLLLNANVDTVRCNDANSDICKYAYVMNVDDNFNITIKNTNTTLATVVYNMVTANTLDKNTRIYVNYGGTILANKWYGDIDYAKMKHDNLTLDKLTSTTLFLEKREYKKSSGENNPIYKITESYKGEYAIAFDVKPTTVTELKEKGKLSIANYTGYNFAMGNSKPLNENSMLSVSVGINGISLITGTSVNLKASSTNLVNLPWYDKEVERTHTVQETYTYIDEETGETKTGVREKIEKYIEYISEQRKITDYRTLNLKCVSQGIVQVTLLGKNGVSDYYSNITVSDSNKLLVGLNKTINNPTASSVTDSLGQVFNRGTNVNYSINITNTTIGISANKYISNEMAILSYPMTINDYTNVKVHVKQNDVGKYIAELYINSEKVDESIEMEVMPEVNIVGKTYIGNEQRYFEGFIKNLVLYKVPKLSN